MADGVTNEVELGGIRTRAPRVVRMLELIPRFAKLDTPVLIQGETGTGKALVARALHALSGRAARQLVTIDCAAVPESIAESELFGHERGSFTGADRSYAGRIQAAAEGTLLLDEINSLPLPLQGKLLRFLEEKEFSRVGHQRPVQVDVRVIAASNVRLEEAVASGRMRGDFFYRLNVLRIDVPPLRERLDDLPLLVRQFLAEDPTAQRRGIVRASDEVLDRLRTHSWPGNVRELRNALRQSVALSSDGEVLTCVDLGTGDQPADAATASVLDRPPSAMPFRAWMRECEQVYLTDLLDRYGTVTQQATASGLPQRTFYRKVRSLGLRARRRLRALDEVGSADRSPAAQATRG